MDLLICFSSYPVLAHICASDANIGICTGCRTSPGAIYRGSGRGGGNPSRRYRNCSSFPRFLVSLGHTRSRLKSPAPWPLAPRTKALRSILDKLDPPPPRPEPNPAPKPVGEPSHVLARRKDGYLPYQ